MIGPLFEGLAVCEGIARAAQFLLKELHVECTYQSGYVKDENTSGYHAWNLVNIDGSIKKMDITWDLANSNGHICPI
jgi:transglutaminase/protease-like cytokinesis protein 3